MFAQVQVTVGQGGDGALLLSSAEALGDYPVTVLHSLRRWAAARPGSSAGRRACGTRTARGRTVSYGAAVTAADAIGVQALLELGLGPRSARCCCCHGNGVNHLLMTPSAR